MAATVQLTPQFARQIFLFTARPRYSCEIWPIPLSKLCDLSLDRRPTFTACASLVRNLAINTSKTPSCTASISPAETRKIIPQPGSKAIPAPHNEEAVHPPSPASPRYASQSPPESDPRGRHASPRAIAYWPPQSPAAKPAAAPQANATQHQSTFERLMSESDCSLLRAGRSPTA